MTFASRKQSERKCFLFGLPGNPVSVHHQMSFNNPFNMNKNVKTITLKKSSNFFLGFSICNISFICFAGAP